MALFTRISFFFLLVLHALPICAQFKSIDFEYLSVENGLSQNTVSCIYQDQRGFLWLGTEYGLNRYDGYNVKVFKYALADSFSISDNRIRDIAEDPKGDLWIGTEEGGLNKYDRRTNKFERYGYDPNNPKSLTSNNITAVACTATGVVWVGTSNNGLNRIDPGTATVAHFVHDPTKNASLSNNSVNAIAVDRLGNTWIATDKGLSFVQHGNEIVMRYAFDFLDAPIEAVAPAGRGSVWIVSQSKIYYIKDALTAPKPIPAPETQSRITSICEDSQRQLWVGSYDGLMRLDMRRNAWSIYKHFPADRNSLSSNNVKCVFEDKSGIVWIGTYSGGASKYVPSRQQFGHYRHINGDYGTLTHNDVMSFLKDRSGRLWVGTAKGLDCFDANKRIIAYYRYDAANPASLPGQAVTALAQDSTGRIWVGTHQGLAFFDEKQKSFQRILTDPDQPKSLSNNSIYALLAGSDGALWVGTGVGLNRLDNVENQTFTRFISEEDNPIGIAGNIVTCMKEDQKGVIWVGTYDGGLSKFNPNTEIFKSYRHVDNDYTTLSSNAILSLEIDSKNKIWVGTFEGGLNSFDAEKEQFTHYTEKEGLPNTRIYGILEDKNGRLWISTNDKLTRFDVANESFKDYDYRYGLQGNEFNTGAYLKTADGELLFGGPMGFNAFHPDSISDNNYAAPVALVGFELFNKTVEIGGDSPLQSPIGETEVLLLDYTQNTFSFEFSALSFHLSERNQYAYMLEGLDEDWQYVGTRRKAYYTSLPPGEYLFRVKGTNNDGVWNKNDAHIKVVVAAPIWMQLWFKILCAVLLLAIAYGIYWQYTQNMAVREDKILIALEVARTENNIKQHKLNSKTEELRGLSEEVDKYKDKLLHKDQELRRKDRDIQDSHSYAARIQQSMFLKEEQLRTSIESFVLYQPRTAVGGDFYWFSEGNRHTAAVDSYRGRTVIAVGDCSGKGISGALLAMVGYQMLHEIVNLQGVRDAKRIMDVLSHNIEKTLNANHQGNIFYGMDMAICVIDWHEKIIEVSGAMLPVFYFQHGELRVVKGDGYPVGIYAGNEFDQGYSKSTIQMNAPISLYLATDGFQDQIGGPDHRKYMAKRLKEFASGIYSLPMPQQKLLFEREFIEWKGDNIQIDDLCVLGIKV